MAEQIKDSITIPSWNLERLDHEVKKLNKRAVKLGLTPFTYTYETRLIKDPRAIHEISQIEDKEKQVPMVEVADVTFHGAGPKIEGWKFVGSLDHVTFPEDVLVKTVPGETIPPQYFHASANCDHCNKIRRRRDTFVLQNETTGEYQQIGRQCIKDHIGHDPESIARLLSSFWSMIDSAEDDDRMGFGYGRSEYVADSKEVLRLTIRSIKLYGWLSRGKADEHQQPTSSRISFLLSTPVPRMVDEWRAEHALYDTVADVADEDAEIAAALAWLDDQSADNEYIHNLKSIAKMDAVPFRLFGFWCSLVAAYQRAAEHLKEQERQKKVSEYIGNKGDRFDMTVTVTRSNGFDSYYGWVTVISMIDDAGRTVVWFANTKPNMHIGKTYKIKATVKKHELYKEWKQTHVSRVSVIEEVA